MKTSNLIPEQAIARLNTMAGDAHRAYLEKIGIEPPTSSSSGLSGDASALYGRYLALLDAIEVVRKIRTREVSHV